MITTDSFIVVEHESSERRTELKASQTDTPQLGTFSGAGRFDYSVVAEPTLTGAMFATLTFSGTHFIDRLMVGTYSALVGGPETSFIVSDAERRLAQLQADIEQPKFFEDDDSSQLPISGAAIERARGLIRSFASWGFGPAHHIAIFAMPNGGLQLQSTGSASAVSIRDPTES